MASKTPAQILHEICAKVGICPFFNVSQRAHPDINNVFLFECTCTVTGFEGQTYEAVGAATSKVAAKQAACDIMLREKMRMNFQDPDFVNNVLTTPKPEAEEPDKAEEANNNVQVTADPQPVQDAALQNNPIKDLDDLVLHNTLPPIQFEFEDMYGTPNNPLFVAWCTVGMIRKSGTTSKKKLSKRIAYYKVLMELKKIETQATGFQGLQQEIYQETKEEIAQIFRAAKEARETRLKEVYKEKGTVFARKPIMMRHMTLEDYRRQHDNARHDYTNFKIGPVVTELLDATQNLSELDLDPDERRELVRMWLKNRESGAGVSTFFKLLRKEIGFNMIAVKESLDPVAKKRPRVKQRPEREPHVFLDFKGMVAAHKQAVGVSSTSGAWGNNRAHMVCVELEMKDEKIRKMPTTVGFGATPDEAFIEAELDIILHFITMFRTSTIS